MDLGRARRVRGGRISPLLLHHGPPLVPRSGNLRPWPLAGDRHDGLQDNQDEDLAATEADLRGAAANERRFDHQLIAIAFPPQTEPIVRLLCHVDQARAALTQTAAAATSLRQVNGYQQRLDAANEPVEEAVTVIRSQLRLPPSDTSCRPPGVRAARVYLLAGAAPEP